jgi:uncharacterized protein (TIGR02246 family)
MNDMTKKPIVQLAAAMMLGCLSVATAARAQEVQTSGATKTVPPAAAGALTDRPEDEKAIRAMADTFTRAFGAGNAKAVAAMYSDDAESIGDNGERVRGRPAIEALYSSIFQARPAATIGISIDSLRFLSPEVAMEEGHTRVKSRGEPEILRRYTVLYVKQKGQWLYSSVREEHAAGVAHHEHLKALEWLVGEWVEQSSNSTVHATCRWSDDQNFLLRDFKINVQGQPVMTAHQRIGWDPIKKQIKSWVFDSGGGYGEGLWTRRGTQWVIKSTDVLPDGQTASSTHVLAPTGSNSARWTSTERTLGDQSFTEPADYVMVRRPPAPKKDKISTQSSK